MITSYALEEGGILEFSEGTYIIITAYMGTDGIYCVLKKERSPCIKTITFKRAGGDIKSGINLKNCIRYTPPERVLGVGQKYKDLTIRKILRKTEEGWHCLVSYGSAISCFLRIIPT